MLVLFNSSFITFKLCVVFDSCLISTFAVRYKKFVFVIAEMMKLIKSRLFWGKMYHSNVVLKSYEYFRMLCIIFVFLELFRIHRYLISKSNGIHEFQIAPTISHCLYKWCKQLPQCFWTVSQVCVYIVKLFPKSIILDVAFWYNDIKVTYYSIKNALVLRKCLLWHFSKVATLSKQKPLFNHDMTHEFAMIFKWNQQTNCVCLRTVMCKYFSSKHDVTKSIQKW